MSTTTFHNVALLGATGNLGSAILQQLTNAGFAVTAIQRAESTNQVPPQAKSLKVDLTSQSQLTAAFKGQDVVVSAVPNPTLSNSKIWIQAAIDAGLKRVVPSEFASNLEKPLSRQLPIMKDKIEIRTYVEELAKAGKIDWTSVNNGPFLTPLWTFGLIGPNFSKRTTRYHDGGDHVVCTSTLEQIGLAVARVLSPEHAASTANKPVYIHSITMSERRMTALAAKVLGIEVSDFRVEDRSIEEVTKGAWEAVGRGDMSRMGDFYIPLCFGERYGGDFREISWNERLGLTELAEEELEGIVKSWV